MWWFAPATIDPRHAIGLVTMPWQYRAKPRETQRAMPTGEWRFPVRPRLRGVDFRPGTDCGRASMKRLHLGTLVVALALTQFGCVSGKSLQDRHSMSRLWASPDGSDIFFEASVGPDYPLNSAAAEAQRRSWMGQWLDRARLCPDGFEIIDRRQIGSAIDNPYHHDLRYTLRCVSAS
jgi:hypothetical protein